MNEFCKSCEDRNTELCPLPGRMRLAAESILEVMVVMGSAYAGPSSLNSVPTSYGNGTPELNREKVVDCIELHQLTRTED